MSIVVAHEPSPFLSHATQMYSAYMQRAQEQRRIEAEQRARDQQAMANMFGSAIKAIADKKAEEDQWTYDWTPAQRAKMQEIDNNIEAVRADSGLDPYTKEEYIGMLENQKDSMQKTKVPKPPKIPTVQDRINSGEVYMDKENGFMSWTDPDGKIQTKTFSGTNSHKAKIDAEIIKQRSHWQAEHIKRQEDRYLDSVEDPASAPPFKPDLEAARRYAMEVVPDPYATTNATGWQGMGADMMPAMPGMPSLPSAEMDTSSVLMPNGQMMQPPEFPAVTPDQASKAIRMMMMGGEDPLDWAEGNFGGGSAPAGAMPVASPPPEVVAAKIKSLPPKVAKQVVAEAEEELAAIKKKGPPYNVQRLNELIAIIEGAR